MSSTDDSSELNDAQEMLRSLRRIIRSTTIHSRKLYKQHGLTITRLLCLRAIDEVRNKEVTASMVSREVQLSPATVTGILDRMERDGLVRRERSSKDRRKVYLSITPAGQERLTYLPTTLQDRFLDRVLAMSLEKRHNLVDSLHLLEELMEASSLEASPILIPGDVEAPPADT